MRSVLRWQSFGGGLLWLLASCSIDREPAYANAAFTAMGGTSAGGTSGSAGAFSQPDPFGDPIAPGAMSAGLGGANAPAGASAAGAGGAAGGTPTVVQPLDAGAQAAGGSSGSAGGTLDAAVADATTTTPFTLTAVGASMLGADAYAFPATALPPTNQSPGFMWTGVPKEAKSLVLVFRDLENGAVKWVIWDIPPSVTHVPANVSRQAMPAEIPGSSQLGSLGNQGYAGPCCTDRSYEFVLWALDVEELPGTVLASTARIHTEILPDHDLATTPPLIMRIMP
jgi:Raf kinase inhibitor-like YbhB/YbcL family protein